MSISTDVGDFTGDVDTVVSVTDVIVRDVGTTEDVSGVAVITGLEDEVMDCGG